MTTSAAAPDPALHAAIGAVPDEYFTRWSASDMKGLEELWDADEPDPIYVAEERESLIGREALRGYWRPPQPGTLERQLRYAELHVRPVAEDVVLAFYALSWNVYMRHDPVYARPIGGHVRGPRCCAAERRAGASSTTSRVRRPPLSRSAACWR